MLQEKNTRSNIKVPDYRHTKTKGTGRESESDRYHANQFYIDLDNNPDYTIKTFYTSPLHSKYISYQVLPDKKIIPSMIFKDSNGKYHYRPMNSSSYQSKIIDLGIDKYSKTTINRFGNDQYYIVQRFITKYTNADDTSLGLYPRRGYNVNPSGLYLHSIDCGSVEHVEKPNLARTVLPLLGNTVDCVNIKIVTGDDLTYQFVIDSIINHIQIAYNIKISLMFKGTDIVSDQLSVPSDNQVINPIIPIYGNSYYLLPKNTIFPITLLEYIQGIQYYDYYHENVNIVNPDGTFTLYYLPTQKIVFDLIGKIYTILDLLSQYQFNHGLLTCSQVLIHRDSEEDYDGFDNYQVYITTFEEATITLYLQDHLYRFQNLSLSTENMEHILTNQYNRFTHYVITYQEQQYYRLDNISHFGIYLQKRKEGLLLPSSFDLYTLIISMVIQPGYFALFFSGDKNQLYNQIWTHLWRDQDLNMMYQRVKHSVKTGNQDLKMTDLFNLVLPILHDVDLKIEIKIMDWI